ncbi:DASH complex subunit Duo1-domain-containing protein [Chaetomium sp. MPI-SDFR-AT-0129]|nr:DASH complex subunit Duo1-domain-containing protein [Chaetomium sp. MPI-SDFR-AT-0129]
MADDFNTSDHEDDSFASPPEPTPAGRSKTPTRQGGSRFDTDESREAALRKELEGVRKVNEVIEGVIGTLERARGNMGTVSQTVTGASTLLNTWTRILSQTEHNQRLLLNRDWKGSTQDVADMENEALQKQQEAERHAAEAERRREEARRRAEDDERKRSAGTSSRTGTAGRGSGITRGRTTTRGVGGSRGAARGGASSAADTTTSSTGGSRNTSGIGRGGFGYTRGARSRGVR